MLPAREDGAAGHDLVDRREVEVGVDRRHVRPLADQGRGDPQEVADGVAARGLPVLARGYSITLDEAGHVLRSAAGTGPGRAISVRLAAGSLAARVEEARE